MSLSFVSKSIQTTAQDGTFEEKPIENAGGADNDDSSNRPYDARPLFEQLRDNKEQAEAEREEYQRSLMSGTMALDEEDCAHLDSLRRIREEQELQKNQRLQDELTAFRAAKADLLETKTTSGGSNNNQQQSSSAEESGKIRNSQLSESQQRTEPQLKSKAPSAFVPQIMVKKRRRADDSTGQSSDKREAAKKEIGVQKMAVVQEPQPAATKVVEGNGMAGLLTGYGSSSDED